jgi:hypothetical protein
VSLIRRQSVCIIRLSMQTDGKIVVVILLPARMTNLSRQSYINEAAVSKSIDELPSLRLHRCDGY